MPKVSVVIPAYNTVHFLPQTVKSVLQQTFQDFEIIVVNDGSTDGTELWLSQLEQPQLTYITQNNQGLPATRNTGIAAAQGAYIAFLDADDLWEPTKLEQQVACLDARPEVGLVHTAIRYIDEQNYEINRIFGVEGDGNVWQKVVVHNPVRCGSTPMVRRDCFATVGVFDPTLTFSEDWDMWIRIAAHYPFATINEPLVSYRQHGTNMTKGYQAIMPNFIKIIERAFENTPAGSESLKQEAYGRAYLFAAGRAFGAGDLDESFSLLRQAFDHHPRLRYTKYSLHLIFQLFRKQWLGRGRSGTLK